MSDYDSTIALTAHPSQLTLFLPRPTWCAALRWALRPSAFLLAYVPRTTAATRALFDTAWSEGFDFRPVPWPLFMADAPVHGAVILRFTARASGQQVPRVEGRVPRGVTQESAQVIGGPPISKALNFK